MTTEEIPTQPRPGDVVELIGPGRMIGVELGARGVVDSSSFELFDGECLVCFAASAYRVDDHVSCSGGPVPFIKFADLTYAGTTVRTFWKFKDGIRRAGNGENYQLEVNLWTWEGQHA